jgi:hypothetical protein
LPPWAGKLSGAIGRAVVGNQDLQLARVLLLGDVVDRFLDRLHLVEASDDDGERRKVEVEAQRRRAVDQQRGDQVGVEVAGNDRDSEDRRHRERHRDRLAQGLDPGNGQPEREAGPGEGDADHHHQLEGELDVDPAAFLRCALEVLDLDRRLLDQG